LITSVVHGCAGLRRAIAGILTASLLISKAVAAVTYSSATNEPPWVMREFRGMWIATVGNIDWPTNPALPVAQQKRELIAILDRAAALNLNGVVLQVRSICDALYDSKIEPWSYYLTGAMGRAPSPYYDPLAFAIEEAHKRGLELHAWFSPYRAGPPNGSFPIAAGHISRTRPDWVRRYGTQIWLDPGEREVQDYTIGVVMDVVNRYDLDGVHFDDRMGYPEQEPQTKNRQFPDDVPWRRYLAEGGTLGRDDWRRENVNTFVSRVYFSIKAAKPWVKFGVAPRGIWQPGNPPQIKGQNSYSSLYTDSRKWLMNGWLDYCSPQLYWQIAPREQSFSVLLNWWRGQNPRQRNLWPGLYTDQVGKNWKAPEIISQIKIDREQLDGAAGEIHYSARSIMENHGRIADALAAIYARPALIPPSPWLEKSFPEKPFLTVENGRRAAWSPAGAERISVWVWQTRANGQWTTQIVPGGAGGIELAGQPELVAVTAIDRCGVASPPAVLRRDNN
jgi:uncharacterized lipoprotein YddW (UPF0748 family)